MIYNIPTKFLHSPHNLHQPQTKTRQEQINAHLNSSLYPIYTSKNDKGLKSTKGNSSKHETKRTRLLLAKDLDTLLNRLLHLLASSSLVATEDQLGDETPVGGDVPVLGDGGVDEGVVVLQVGAEAEGLEACPDYGERRVLGWLAI